MARKCFLITVKTSLATNHYVRKASSVAEAIEIGKKKAIAAEVDVREVSVSEVSEEYYNEWRRP